MKTVVFDFGAVLFRWQPELLLQQVLPDLAPNGPAARALAAQIFDVLEPGSDWARFDLGEVEAADLAVRLARRLEVEVQAMERLIDAIPAHMEPLVDSVGLLHRLKAQGHRLFYLSNMPRGYAEHLSRHHDIVPHFIDGIFSARVGLAKPDDAIFQLARERFSLQPQATVFIDDHPKNIEAARRHGWHAVLFESAPQLASALTDLGWLADDAMRLGRDAVDQGRERPEDPRRPG